VTGPFGADPRIVVVGSTMVDLVAFADRLPEAGETVVGTRFHQGFGGKGANQAVMAARLRAAVWMVAAVGADANGEAIRANLRAQDVRVDDVATVEATSGVAPIWVDGAGMNRIVIVPGANRLVDGAVAAAAVRRARPQVVVGQFEIPQAVTARAFAAARETGATTVLNPAPGASIEPDLLAVSDWIVPNETEFVAIGGRPLRGDAGAEDPAIHELGERLGAGLIVTLGARGAAVRGRDGTIVRVPSPPADAVDTTGAGDAFVGAFAVALAGGWPPSAAARLGCALASDSVTRVVTQTSFPTWQRARPLIEELAP
jgi:ribokinase